MFGTYQSSCIRIEIAASAERIAGSLTEPEQLEKWLWPQQIKLSKTAKGWSKERASLNQLLAGQEFESTLGPLKVNHCVEMLSPDGIRFVLSGGIDGFHEWQWGEGWVQSRLEGISLVPLNLGQTLSLMRLRAYLVKA
ncbi:MAG: hypothetical protein DCF25_11390 [Leptolyngbya foveolarum]|uniref:Polyketide cyclase n=1 Tax=Leptolyngbya foveolarum TaxID=47253 RepID=A0A2W4U8C7_9CYAN|nr:MAG: hypothetical protein DCF25_11390 [Leptolyngbya foveolarum]